MQSLEVLLLGISTRHTRDFTAYRPNGMGCYLITCFETPFSCLTKYGWENGEPGDCIIISPEFPELHRATVSMDDGFINDWLHLIGSSVPELLNKYDLPCNTILRTGCLNLLTPELSEIRQELFKKEKFHSQRIELLLENALLKIARSTATRRQEALYTAQESHYLPIFLELRQTLLTEYAKPWTVKEMADRISLSESRFSTLYRKFFQVSPYDDLMQLRLESARRLLLSSSDSINEVAEKCGFSNPYYFSRIFRQSVGCCPRRYRQGYLSGHSADNHLASGILTTL